MGIVDAHLGRSVIGVVTGPGERFDCFNKNHNQGNHQLSAARRWRASRVSVICTEIRNTVCTAASFWRLAGSMRALCPAREPGPRGWTAERIPNQRIYPCGARSSVHYRTGIRFELIRGVQWRARVNGVRAVSCIRGVIPHDPH